MAEVYSQDEQRKWKEDYVRIAILWRQLLGNLKKDRNGDSRLVDVSKQLEAKLADGKKFGISEDDIRRINNKIKVADFDSKKSGKELNPEDISKLLVLL
jgi:hypothetical protein